MPPDPPPQVRLRAFGARVQAFGPHFEQMAPFCQMGPPIGSFL